jgi:3-oxoacyl-[acyl-carrier protein] reductase
MKTFVVTGASDGIGAEIARQLAAAHGAEAGLVLAARNREKLDAVAAQCRGLGAQTLVVVTNVSEEAECRTLIDQAVQQFGRLDALINNAGALIRRTPIAEYTEDYVDALLDLNVKPVVRFTREAVVVMQAQGTGGSIVNLSSIAARHGGGPGSVLYAATKGFVATATRGWAKELVKDR